MNKKLILIFVLALFLRSFRIAQAPERLTHDEMSIAYNAFSIGQTLKDEWGRFLPLDFEAFGDHKLPGYIYASVPFVKIFGLNNWSVKIPSILAGSLLVLVIYFLALELKFTKKTALLAALLTAINPWPLQLSRMAFESNLALLFFTTGLLFLFRDLKLSLKERSPFGRKILAAIFFALSFYTYVAYRLIVVLVLVATFIFTKNKKNISQLILLLCVFLLPLLGSVFAKSGTARFSQISIFKDEGVRAEIMEKRNFCFLSSPALNRPCQLFFNKYLFFPQLLVKNYAQILSPQFLFIEGDTLKYLNPAKNGEFLLILLPFYCLGFYYLLQNKNSRQKLFLLFFFLAPLPTILVGEPQIVRASAMLPFLIILIALALAQLNYKFLIFVLFATSIYTGQYLLNYHFVYSHQDAAAFYPLPAPLFSYLQKEEPNFDLIYIDDHFPDAHIGVAFYGKLNPLVYQKNILRPASDNLGFRHPYQLLKYQFGRQTWDQLVNTPGKVLYVTLHHDVFTDKERKALTEFKDFSGVHTQVQVFNLAKFNGREELPVDTLEPRL